MVSKEYTDKASVDNHAALVNYHLQQLDCCYSGPQGGLCGKFAIVAYILPLGGMLSYCRNHMHRVQEIEDQMRAEGIKPL